MHKQQSKKEKYQKIQESEVSGSQTKGNSGNQEANQTLVHFLCEKCSV